METPLNGDTKVILNELKHIRKDIEEVKDNQKAQTLICEGRIGHCTAHFSTIKDNETVRRAGMWVGGFIILAIVGSYGAYGYAAVIKEMLIKHLAGG